MTAAEAKHHLLAVLDMLPAQATQARYHLLEVLAGVDAIERRMDAMERANTELRARYAAKLTEEGDWLLTRARLQRELAEARAEVSRDA